MNNSTKILICLFCITSVLGKNALKPHIIMPDLSKLPYLPLDSPKEAVAMNAQGEPIQAQPKFDTNNLIYSALVDDSNKQTSYSQENDTTSKENDSNSIEKDSNSIEKDSKSIESDTNSQENISDSTFKTIAN